MAKKDKAGFNSPFAKLKELPKKQAQGGRQRGDVKAGETAHSRQEPHRGRNAKTDEESRHLASGSALPLRNPTAAPPEAEQAAENDEFLRAVGGVVPLAKEARRVEPHKRLVSEQPDDDALALAELQALVEGDTPFRVVESEEFYSGAAPGVNHDLVERLREGAFSFRRHVDLHGYTRDDAKTALADFIAAARRDGERCVLVVTGRGKSSPGGVSVLREALPRWLGRFPLRSHVLAFCTARSVDGGPGAFYVLLRRMGSRPYGGA